MLNEEAYGFQNKAKKVKRKMWWKNMKLMIIAVILAVILIAGILMAVLFATGAI